MPGLISQYQQTAFVNPQNGQSGDATVVLSNDNATRAKHNGHDADATIHIQSSDLATRAAAGVAQRVWWTTDEFRLYFDFAGVWNPLKVRAEDIIAGTMTGPIVITGDLTVDTDTLIVDAANGRVGIGATPVYRLDVALAAGAGNVARIGQTGVSNGYTVTSDGVNLTHTWSVASSADVVLSSLGLTVNVPATFAAAALFNGNVTLGNANTDSITLTGRLASHAVPIADATYDLGIASFNRFRNLFLSGSVTAGSNELSSSGLVVNDPGGTDPVRIGGPITLGNNVTVSGGRVSVVRAAATGYSDYFEADNGTNKVALGLFSTGVGLYRNGNSGVLSFITLTNLGGAVAGLQVQHSLVIDDSNVLIYINGSMFRVRVGAADSGGTGFRMLRVDN